MNRPVGYLGVLYILGPIITSLVATALIVRSRSRFGWLLAAGYLQWASGHLDPTTD